MNESEFLAITCSLLKARKDHAYRLPLVLVSLLIGLKSWLHILKPITARSNRNRVITLASHLIIQISLTLLSTTIAITTTTLVSIRLKASSANSLASKLRNCGAVSVVKWKTRIWNQTNKKCKQGGNTLPFKGLPKQSPQYSRLRHANET